MDAVYAVWMAEMISTINHYNPMYYDSVDNQFTK